MINMVKFVQPIGNQVKTQWFQRQKNPKPTSKRLTKPNFWPPQNIYRGYFAVYHMI